MKRKAIHHIVPGAIMAGAVAVPIASVVSILSHVSQVASATGLNPVASGSPSSASPRTSAGKSTSGGSPARKPASSAGGSTTIQGPQVQEMFGTVQAAVTIVGGKITSANISAPMDNPNSAYINQQAVPMLQQETLQAQSANINLISGATVTSQAYQQSLQAALGQARSQGHPVTGTP